MSAALRSLLRDLASRAAGLAAWLVVHWLLGRWLVDWDAGQHLLVGDRGTTAPLAVLLGFLAFHLATYFLVPPLVAISCVQAVAHYVEERRAQAH